MKAKSGRGWVDGCGYLAGWASIVDGWVAAGSAIRQRLPHADVPFREAVVLLHDTSKPAVRVWQEENKSGRAPLGRRAFTVSIVIGSVTERRRDIPWVRAGRWNNVMGCVQD